MTVCVWPCPATHPPLGEGAVHLWCVSLELPSHRVEVLRHILTEQEQARSDRLRSPLLRDRSIITRVALRLLLGRYLKRAPETISFTLSVQGKPKLAGETADLCFNLTHSADCAVYAFALKRAVGIDVEQIRSTSYALAVARRHWTEDEVQSLEHYARRGEAFLARGFLEVWTRKEAWLKAIGMGLQRPMDSFRVSGPEAPPQLLAVEEGAQEVARWWMQSFAPAAGYVGTLVTEGTSRWVDCYTFDLNSPLSPDTIDYNI